MNRNLARRGKKSEQIAFNCFGIAIALCVVGVLLSTVTQSVVAWTMPVMAVPVTCGGLVAWYRSTKWHREFLRDAPWTEGDDKIRAIRRILGDLKSVFIYRVTYSQLEHEVEALKRYLSQMDAASAAELETALRGGLLLDDSIRYLEFLVMKIKAAHDDRWQKERADWDRVWREA